MSKHTPGPWTVELNIGIRGHAMIHADQLQSGTGRKVITLAEIWGSGELCEANARLIAASPELLGACKAFQKWLGHSTDDQTERIGRLVDSAIAKAEGELNG